MSGHLYNNRADTCSQLFQYLNGPSLSCRAEPASPYIQLRESELHVLTFGSFSTDYQLVPFQVCSIGRQALVERQFYLISKLK